MCKHSHDLSLPNAWLVWRTSDGKLKRTCRECNRARQKAMRPAHKVSRHGVPRRWARLLGAYGEFAYPAR